MFDLSEHMKWSAITRTTFSPCLCQPLGDSEYLNNLLSFSGPEELAQDLNRNDERGGSKGSATRQQRIVRASDTSQLPVVEKLGEAGSGQLSC